MTRNRHQTVRLDWPGKVNLAHIAASPAKAPSGDLPALENVSLLHGDNFSVLNALRPVLGGRVDLVATDPPFNTGSRQRGASGAQYADAWGGGMAGYLDMLAPRLVLLRELLAPDGLLALHCGVAAQPYLRALLDELFGPDRLVNDIVWSYRSGGGSRRRLGQKHDHILVYARGTEYPFDPDAVRVPYDAVIAEKRRDLFHPEGKVAGDVWDLSRPPNHAKEWTGYPTQKPVALYERLIRAFSREGALVLDPFCGSGTTGEAAVRTGRRCVLVDSSEEAVAVAQGRLQPYCLDLKIGRPLPDADAPA